ncbi:MAG TPA: STAS domain-containing protein [Kofleriaceae bacterium]|nr:STAS domain-containing protein [Kofleriaceae bacterium]
MPALPTRMRITPEDKLALAAYWKFFEPVALDVNHTLRESLLKLPEWAPIIKAQTPAALDAQELEGMGRQRAAFVDGNWAPYLDDLRKQGIAYANMGISFVAWYDIIAIYRDLIRQRLIDTKLDRDAMLQVGEGMNRAIDIAMSHLGEAYLAAKEQIISTQQEAIRELSMPVLQVREQLLVIPLVGVLDSTRARQLIESLLGAIRDRRAHGVVIDVTGVPIVDTAVAAHLVQACDAASLMGTLVVITGISPEMAVTLVSLGAKLPAAETLVDLQEGIEYIEKALAVQSADAAARG